MRRRRVPSGGDFRVDAPNCISPGGTYDHVHQVLPYFAPLCIRVVVSDGGL